MHACEELVLAHKSSNSGSYTSLVNTHSPWVCIITNHTGGSPMLATTDATMMDRYPYNWVWYKKTARKGVCSVCAAGSFSNTTASASCKLCPRGKFQPDPGRTLCFNCASGESSSEGCSICAPRSAGKYSLHGICTSCPSNSHSLEKSGIISDCLCNSGSDGTNGGPLVALAHCVWLVQPSQGKVTLIATHARVVNILGLVLFRVYLVRPGASVARQARPGAIFVAPASILLPKPLCA